MNTSKLSVILEATRYIGVFIGFFLAFSHMGHAVDQLNVLAPWIAISLCGLIGIELLISAAAGTNSVGYQSNPEFQRQSGMNNLAVAITAVLAYTLNWGLYANTAVLCVVVIFIVLSGVNHAWSYLRGGNRDLKNLSRPFASLILAAAVLPFIIRALKAG